MIGFCKLIDLINLLIQHFIFVRLENILRIFLYESSRRAFNERSLVNYFILKIVRLFVKIIYSKIVCSFVRSQSFVRTCKRMNEQKSKIKINNFYERTDQQSSSFVRMFAIKYIIKKKFIIFYEHVRMRWKFLLPKSFCTSFYYEIKYTWNYIKSSSIKNWAIFAKSLLRGIEKSGKVQSIGREISCEKQLVLS